MDQEDKIPKFTYDLLAQLNEALVPISYPMTGKGWGRLDENSLRELAFYAGQRALVDMLLDWQERTNEGEDGDSDREAGLVEDTNVYGRVLGTNKEHQGLASISVARTNIGAMLDLDTDE